MMVHVGAKITHYSAKRKFSKKMPRAELKMKICKYFL